MLKVGGCQVLVVSQQQCHLHTRSSRSFEAVHLRNSSFATANDMKSYCAADTNTSKACCCSYLFDLSRITCEAPPLSELAPVLPSTINSCCHSPSSDRDPTKTIRKQPGATAHEASLPPVQHVAAPQHLTSSAAALQTPTRLGVCCCCL
jgi:hypothetical protein